MVNDNESHRTPARSATAPVSRRSFLGAAGAASMAGIAGCMGSGGGQDTITIGAQYLLSGLAESLGAASLAAAELAIKTVNEDGGILGSEVEFISRDHENSADNANQNFRDLVQNEGAVAMIGLTSSGVTLSTAPTVEELGIPFILTDIGTPFITEFDTDTYGENAQGRANIFRTNANTSINCWALAKYATEELDVSTVGNLGPDYAYGHQCWEYFKAYSTAMGADFDFVASQFPEVGASDMTPQINTVQNADPDLVFTSFWAGDTVTFVNQAAEQGLFDQVVDVLDTLGADPTIFAALGDQMPEDISFGSWYWFSAYDTPENQAFVDAWRQEYEGTDIPGVPSIAGPSTWSAIFMYKQAMENAGSTDRDDIISELEGMEFDSPEGPIRIDPDSHQANAPTVIGKTSRDDDVPYDGVGLEPTQVVDAPDRDTLADLLAQADTDLPPGV